MMRINKNKLRTIFEFVSTNVLSGLENVVVNICLLVNNYKIVYVSPSGQINNYLKKYHITHIVVNKLTPFSVRSIIKRYKPNVVHGHDVKASLYLAVNKRLCHKYGIKIISELHNDDYRMWHLGLRSLLYALSTPCYDNVVVVSNAIYHHYIFKKFIKNKVIVIPNIVNVNRINNKYLSKASKKKWDCIFLGRLVNQKNPLAFVKIIYELKKYNKHIKAIMVGTGKLSPYIMKIIRRLGLNKNIKMLGFQTNPYKYLKYSKICIMPSKFEGFGLVALESLIVGTPVLASPTGGLIKIVTNSCGGFAKNVFSFSRKAHILLSNHEYYHLTMLNSFKRAKDINNIDEFILKYKKIYS